MFFATPSRIGTRGGVLPFAASFRAASAGEGIPRSKVFPLPSGAAIQADIIPVSRTPGISVNMEDGLILADDSLRADLARRYPEMFERMQNRWRFMVETLGYSLSEDILPVGDMPGAYFPCLLDAGRVVVHE